MDDLIAFLKARLDEDEQVARAAHGPNWNAEKRDVAYGDEWIMSALTRADAAHIARHDPARVLREVAAKRKIIAKYEIAVLSVRAAKGTSLTGAAKIVLSAYENVLRILAEPGTDHPDYREEWKP